MLHPAFPDCTGHEIWKRDFTGSASVFSFVFHDHISADQAIGFIDGLSLFKIGLSWGGVNSLAVVYPPLDRQDQDYGGRIVRLNSGVENTGDLIADLAASMDALN